MPTGIRMTSRATSGAIQRNRRRRGPRGPWDRGATRRPAPAATVIVFVVLVAVVAEPGDEPAPGVVLVVVAVFVVGLTVRPGVALARAGVVAGGRGVPSGGLGAGRAAGSGAIGPRNAGDR